MIKKFTPHVHLGDAFRAACAVLGVALAASGAPLTEREALDRLAVWMDGHPVMGCVAGDAVGSTVKFSENGGSYSVYVVAFSPAGYAVLNSDDRLPLVVAFSASSGVNLADRPGNAFRAALLAHVAKAADTLSGMDDALVPDLSYLCATAFRATAGIEQYGPYLMTTWNQCHPYNLFCPAATNAGAYYGYRAPSGCTPTAYAQVLYYHRWPLYGQSTHSYTDSSGSITGTHSVCFSTPFGWAAMQSTYDPWATSQPGDDEVADLMYRLGVAADANYESGGTGSSIWTLGERLNTYLFYEPIGYASSQDGLLPGLNESLRAGYPCVVAVPGHAIVADGLLDDGGSVSYHINYGWGGDNNGWWSADNVAGQALSYGCTSLKPMLMALPVEETVQAAAGEPVILEWLLPVRREQEAGRILIRRLMPQGGTWGSAAETLEHTVSSGWQLRPEGRSGSCWFTGPNGYSALTLTDIFVPDAATELTFWMKPLLTATTIFRVAVSSDGGDTYTTLSEWSNNSTLNWQSYSVDLGAFAGEQLRIRFELTQGSSYYQNGGVWLDDLSVTSGAWRRWMPFAEDTTLARLEGQPTHFTVMTEPLEPGSYILASVVEDTNATCHALSPAFTLKVLPRFETRLEPGGGVTLTGYNGSSERLEIPSEWEGQPVTGIASNAFGGSPVFSVILPASITTIESGAFAGAEALQRLFFAGDAPAAATNTLAGSAATVYHLPGRAGWSSGFGGRPALLWNPAPLSGAPIGFQDGVFGFTLSGTALIPVQVQAATNLEAAAWCSITNAAINAAGTLHVRDPESPDHAERFYRVVWP